MIYFIQIKASSSLTICQIKQMMTVNVLSDEGKSSSPEAKIKMMQVKEAESFCSINLQELTVNLIRVKWKVGTERQGL
jgi:hypothetical protein